MNGPTSGEAPSTEACLLSYLRTIETCGEGLPQTFLEALRRALSHYGVRTLDRSPELEESLLWIYKAHRRVDQQVSPVLALLERRLEMVETLAPFAEPSFRTLLDRIIHITRERFPAVSDLAREVLYRYFDQPLFERARKQVYAAVEDELGHLAVHPEGADRNARVRALVECPQPLVSLFAARFADASPALRQSMLEVLTRRYYSIRTLLSVRFLSMEGHCYVAAEYDYEGKRIHLFTTHGKYSRLSTVLRAVSGLLPDIPADDDVVLDLYAWHAEGPGDPEMTQQELRALLEEALPSPDPAYCGGNRQPWAQWHGRDAFYLPS